LKPWKAKLILLFGTSIWGATFMFTQIGIKYCSPSLYLVIRFSIALMLSMIFFGKHIIKVTKKTALQGSLLGLFFAVGFLFQTFALRYTTIGNTAFITNLSVIITPFVFWFVAREKIKIFSKLAVFIALIGLTIITNPTSTALNFGDILTVISTLFWALYMSYLHKFTHGTKDFALNTQLVAFQFIGGLPILIIYLLIFEVQTLVWTMNTELLISILFNSVAASFVVSFIQISFQKYTTPTNAAIIFATEPIFASIISFFVLAEVLTMRGYVGAGIMLCAIFVSDTLEPIINNIRNKKKM
jgi:drug/metabolite transporter (DMT)-like permease